MSSAHLLLLGVPLAPITAMLIGLTGTRRHASVAWWPVLGTGISCMALLLAWQPPPIAAIALRLGVGWIDHAPIALTIGLRLDPLSWTIAMLVAAVALAVNVFAVSYMRDQPERVMFHAAMSGFAAAMLLLVLSDSLLLLFAAWEWVGVASWLLIASRPESGAVGAAGKAFIVTRCGDLALLAGLLLLTLMAGSTSLDAVLALHAVREPVESWLLLPLLLMLVGAVTKSAQLPFSSWLPDAMIAQAPVSALLHSATMVAAGTFLLLRLYPLYQHHPLALALILAIGLAGALLAALAACMQTDLKRVLAWSTVSHLGQTWIALGAAVPFAAAFHLCTHAMFKSGLFLAAGAVERACGSHELRKLGGLRATMPLLAASFAVSALALAEVPPLSGFYSSESVLAAVLQNRAGAAPLLLLVGLLAGWYIARAYWAVFERWPGSQARTSQARRYRSLWPPMLALAAAAVGAGAWLAQGLPGMLDMEEPQSASDAWRWAKFGAVIAGLLAGALHMRSRGPQRPAAAQHAEQALDGYVRMHAAIGAHGGAAVDVVERGLDRIVRTAVLGALVFARMAGSGERRLDAGAIGAARAALHAGDGVEAGEVSGLDRGADRLAMWLRALGLRARRAQVGPFYAYGAALFTALAVGAVVWLWWAGT